MSIHKRNKSYTVRWRHSGKHYSKSGFATKREAQAFEASQLANIRSHTFVDPASTKQRFGTIANGWLDAKLVSSRTMSDYQEIYRNLIAPSWARISLGQIRGSEIQRWLTVLSRNQSAPRVKKAFTVFKQMLDFAVASGALENNPAQRLKEIQGAKLLPRKIQKANKPGLTDVEIDALSNAYPNHKLFVQFLAYTGLRFGEAIALRLSDIDLLNWTVSVNKAYSKVGGHLELSQTKSGKHRIVPIPRFLHASLLNLLVSRTDSDGLLFPNSEGKPLDDSRFRKGLKKAARQALGQEISTHHLRHTYASLSVRAGTNPKVLAEAMGHSDIRLTMDLYASILDGDRQAHAELLNVARERSLSDKGSQIVLTFDKQKRKDQSRLGDLNPGPTHYECVALPLS